MTTYYCLPAGELWIRPEGYLHLVWGPGSQDSEAAQDLFNTVLQQLQVTGYRQLLTDQRRRATATEEYIGWLLGDWLTRVGAGKLLTHVAVVTALPLDLRLQAVDVCAQGRRRYGIHSDFFATTEAAQQWLRESSGVKHKH